MILYMGIVLFAPALALETVTGIPKAVAIVVIGVVCAFYSIIGGLRAVLLTDAFQSILMFAAVFTVIISGLINASGFKEIFKAASEGGRLELWKFVEITQSVTSYKINIVIILVSIPTPLSVIPGSLLSLVVWELIYHFMLSAKLKFRDYYQ
jgi:Na+/proline symporter